MATTTISRTFYNTLIDDDGSGTTGSVWDTAAVDALLDAIDALLAATLELGGNVIVPGTLNVTGVATLAASTISLRGVTYTLPSADGTGGYQLTTNGSGTLSWEVAGGGIGISGTPANNYLAVWTAAATLEGPSTLQYDGNKVYINDSSNANQTTGLTINQGAADDTIFDLKSSDVGHTATSVVEADTFGSMQKISATDGGLQITGVSEASTAILLIGLGLNQETGKTTGDVGAVNISGRATSAGAATTLGANGNILAVRNNTTTRFILDGDGDSHQDVGTAWTNFDTHDDVLVLDALAVAVSRDDDPFKDAIRMQFGESLDAMIPRREMERMKLVTFNEDGHHFVNMSKLTMLHTGAIRQLGRRGVEHGQRLAAIEAALRRLEAA